MEEGEALRVLVITGLVQMVVRVAELGEAKTLVTVGQARLGREMTAVVPQVEVATEAEAVVVQEPQGATGQRA